MHPISVQFGFIVVQFPAKSMPNNKLAPLLGSWRPPSGKSWIRHCKCPQKLVTPNISPNFFSGVVVFRDCNNKHIENVCTMKALGKNNSTKVRVCYETCDWDGCNAGPLNSTTAHLQSNNSLRSYIIIALSLLSVVIISVMR